jgi:2-polyprenyl-6-methoxyphenol hydroxylase-like FAD-dependent oxidoreductase
MVSIDLEGVTVTAANTPAVVTRCCIVGAGPAGLMLGFLLARAGVDVIVLEKHGDFLSDFRGDMIHASTLEVMHDLGLLEGLMELPHQKVEEFVGSMHAQRIPLVDFTRLSTRCRFIAYMPQWDFLEFIRSRAARYPAFDLRMSTEVTALITKDGSVVGVQAEGPAGPMAVHADLVVCADGRRSKTREWAGLDVVSFGVPFDVLWMRISRRLQDGESLRYFGAGQIFVTIDRGEYWQCALAIPKGSFDTLKERGLTSFREQIATLVPMFRDRVDELSQWDDVKLLAVSIDRLRKWFRPGLLCIGDAAHAMSPVTGVGVNLAIHDAIATANVLAACLKERTLSTKHLAQVQARREPSTRIMQLFQVALDRTVVKPVLESMELRSMPWGLRLVHWSPGIRRILGRLIAIGFRPERVTTPAPVPQSR